MHSGKDKPDGELWLCSANESVLSRWKEGVAGYSTIQYSSLETLHDDLQGNMPKLALLHLQLPGLDGADGAIILRNRYPSLRMIVFSDRPDSEEAQLLLQYGCHGYFNTYLAPQLLSKAIELVDAGEVIVSREFIVQIINKITHELIEHSDEDIQNIFKDLTGREHEIVRGICQGMSNKRIASSLGISERTVKAHLSSIFRKADVHDRLHLAMKMNKIWR